MKKPIFILPLLIVLINFSCKEKITKEKLTGQWEVTEANFGWEGTNEEILQSMKKDAEGQIYHINDDHSLKIDLKEERMSKGDFRWSYNGRQNLFTIKVKGLEVDFGDERYQIEDFSSEHMTFKGQGLDGFIELHFRKIEN